MTIAEWHKRSRDTEQEGRGVRQRGGASASSGPTPDLQRGGGQKRDSDEPDSVAVRQRLRQGEKRQAEDQLGPTSPALKDDPTDVSSGQVVIECGKLGAFINHVDVAELF